MNLSRRTAKRSRVYANTERLALLGGATKQPTLWARSLTAAWLAVVLAGGPVSPVFAQDPGQTPPTQEQKPPLPVPASPAENRPGQDPNPPTNPPAPAYGPAPTNPPIPVSLGLSKYNYSQAPRPFPNLIAPYR